MTCCSCFEATQSCFKLGQPSEIRDVQNDFVDTLAANSLDKDCTQKIVICSRFCFVANAVVGDQSWSKDWEYTWVGEVIHHDSSIHALMIVDVGFYGFNGILVMIVDRFSVVLRF